MRAITALVVVISLSAATAGAESSFDRLLEISGACDVTATADSAYAELGKFLAEPADSVQRAYAYYLRFRAARALGRIESMRAAADSSVLFKSDDPTAFEEFAWALARARRNLEVAEDYAGRAVVISERGGRRDLLARSLAALGHVQLLREQPTPAAAAFERALAEAYPDSQWALLRLGRALAESGQIDRAIDACVRSVAVYEGDSGYVASAMTRLDSLYRLRHGSDNGLEERLQVAREASRRNTLFDLWRDGRMAPSWRLLDLRDSTYKDSDLTRGVVVLDFWGTWCPPCVAALPALQRLADAYAGKGIRFVTISAEREGPAGSRGRVLSFMDREKLSLQVFGGDTTVVDNYDIQIFPTTLVIEDGKVLYRNPGYREGILGEQLADLVKRRREPGALPAATKPRRER